MKNPFLFQLTRTALVGASRCLLLLLLFAPPSVKADEPVKLTPVAELPDKPDMEALAEELRTLGPEERRERLSRLREKYGTREEQRPARQSAKSDPRARLNRPFPDRAAYTNALAEARNPAARKIDPVMLMEMQRQQLDARLQQYKSLGTNAPVKLEAKIKQLEELNRRIDERLKVLKSKTPQREPGIETEASEEGTPQTGEAERSKEEVPTEEEKSEK